jgi:hypothetical protein
MPPVGRLAQPLDGLGTISLHTASAVKRNGKVVLGLNITAHCLVAKNGSLCRRLRIGRGCRCPGLAGARAGCTSTVRQ